MRTKDEIASDLAKEQLSLEALQYTNVANRSLDDMIKLTAYKMEVQRKIYRLQAEQKEWIEAP